MICPRIPGLLASTQVLSRLAQKLFYHWKQTSSAVIWQAPSLVHKTIKDPRLNIHNLLVSCSLKYTECSVNKGRAHRWIQTNLPLSNDQAQSGMQFLFIICIYIYRVCLCVCVQEHRCSWAKVVSRRQLLRIGFCFLLRGFWGHWTQSSCLVAVIFTHWAISLALICSFFMYAFHFAICNIVIKKLYR